MSGVWPGVIIGENTIHVHISAIRKALGPDRAILKTNSGRGYRLLPAAGRSVRTSPYRTRPRPRSRSPAYLRFNQSAAGDVCPDRPRCRRHRNCGTCFPPIASLALTGPGGIGKTALALKVARGLMPRFADGIWVAELASLSDPDLVASAVATALGIRLGGAPDYRQFGCTGDRRKTTAAVGP